MSGIYVRTLLVTTRALASPLTSGVNGTVIVDVLAGAVLVPVASVIKRFKP